MILLFVASHLFKCIWNNLLRKNGESNVNELKAKKKQTLALWEHMRIAYKIERTFMKKVRERA